MTTFGGTVMTIALVLILVATVLILFRQTSVELFRYCRLLWKKQQPLPLKHQDILRKYSAYYNLLSDTDKQIFQRRVQHFMYSKEFIPRALESVTDIMKVLISASAIQLTFGLPKIYLEHFSKILIYPDSYYSRITRRYHVGEVNPRMGIIILSWKNFMDGLTGTSKTTNLGIHEMAHAMHFENRIRDAEFHFLDEQSLLKLATIMAREMPKIRSGSRHFFRPYAGANEYEFFAVALEYFFDRPVEFKVALPDLYEVLSRLINQDPVRLYKLETSGVDQNEAITAVV